MDSDAPHNETILHPQPSLMHSIKKSLHHIEPTVNPSDAQWDLSKGLFMKLSDMYCRTRLHMTSHLSNLQGLFSTADSVAPDFLQGLDDPQTEISYPGMLKNIREHHSLLNGVVADTLAQELERKTCLKRLSEEIAAHVPIMERIEKRDALREECDYYTNKLTQLKAEQDPVTGSLNANQLIKIERNQVKLDQSLSEYNSFHSHLIQELNEAWSKRISVLGGVMSSFLEIEKSVAQLFQAGSEGFAQQHRNDLDDK